MVTKKASWTTSGGFADFYVFQTTSPDFKEVLRPVVLGSATPRTPRPSPREWDALGLRGNQSGSLLIDNKFMPENQPGRPHRRRRLVERRGGRSVLPGRLVRPAGTASRWARSTSPSRHTTRKTHKDVGLRVCDYPTIQDDVGEAIIDTNAVALHELPDRAGADEVTDGATGGSTASGRVRARRLLPWLWQLKFAAAKNVAHVVDKMLHCLGGTGLQDASRCRSSATCATARPAG